MPAEATLVATPGSSTVILGKNSTWANTSRPDGNSTDDLTIAPSGIRNGTNVQDYLATDSESHTIGQLRFGTDKLLYVTNGDGASYNDVDVRAARVQDVNNLSGKLLRIDPITGRGVSNNPFFDGNADSNRSKVYALGFRNPFRFTIDSQTGQPFVGDVGWFTWEEVNAIERGGNYGWPAYEGGERTSERTTQYQDRPEITPFYSSISNLKSPTLGLAHANKGGDARAIVMGDFYRGNTFPAIYRNSLFINDANTGNLQALFFDGSGRVVDQKRVATLPGAVQLSVGKDSNLYYADLGQGVIGRLRAV
jgi:glucose/arabinose dehydrogenase